MFLSKLKRSKPTTDWSKLKVGDQVVAKTDVPCPVQPFEVEFKKGEICTIEGEGLSTFRWVVVKGRETTAHFALEPKRVWDFIGEWFERRV